MKFYFAFMLVFALFGCSKDPGDQALQVSTNKNGQPKQFDLKGVVVGMSAEKIKEKLGPLQCRPSVERFEEQYGTDWKSKSNINQEPGFEKYRILLIEEADEMCITAGPHKLGIDDAMGVFLLSKKKTVHISFAFKGSGKSFIEALSYKYNWMDPSASSLDKKEIEHNVYTALSQGYYDQKGDVMVFISGGQVNEAAIMTDRLFERLNSAHKNSVKINSGAGNI